MSNKVKATQTEETPVAVTEPDAVLLTFEYEGDTYTVDKAVFSDVDFHEALELNHETRLCRMLVGERGYQKFKSRGKNGKRNTTELYEFGAAALATIGSDLGESED